MKKGLLPATTDRLSRMTKRFRAESHALGQVFLTPEKKFAEFWAVVSYDWTKPNVLIEISTENLDLTEISVNGFFQKGEGEFASNIKIPPENIKKVYTIYPIYNTWTFTFPSWMGKTAIMKPHFPRMLKDKQNA